MEMLPMIHIRAKVLGMLIAVLALGAAVAVPGIAMGEGGPPEASPSLEAGPLAEESCEGATVCAWESTNYKGHRWERACTGVGTTYSTGFIVESLKNRCGNPVKALGGFTNECIASNGSNPSTGIFSEFKIVNPSSC
jgi:Peptidase inhibitor family I36